MKQSYLTLLLLIILGLSACRKEGNDIGIKEYDQNQIQAYITANGLTNMKRDMTDGDTTGIYYEILGQGRGVPLDYDRRVSYVYSVKSLDGKYGITDTIYNHNYAFVANIIPKGLMMAVHNLAKTAGTRARFLIPSRLAYGAAGAGTGSGRLPGNQSLDFYINVLDDTQQVKYDELSIQKYAQANGIDLGTYTHNTTTGLYYKVTTAGTGTVPITSTNTFKAQYTGTLLNGNIFDQFNDQASGNVGTEFSLQTAINGWKSAFPGVTAGAKVSLFIPSGLAYGTAPRTDNSNITIIPAASCLRFEVNVLSVTQ